MRSLIAVFSFLFLFSTHSIQDASAQEYTYNDNHQIGYEVMVAANKVWQDGDHTSSPSEYLQAVAEEVSAEKSWVVKIDKQTPGNPMLRGSNFVMELQTTTIPEMVVIISDCSTREAAVVSFNAETGEGWKITKTTQPNQCQSTSVALK